MKLFRIEKTFGTEGKREFLASTKVAKFTKGKRFKTWKTAKAAQKVLEKFGAAKPGIALYGIDIEENAAAAAALGAERPPTIFVIKGGEVKASKVGLMNPREMAAFFEKA